MSESSDNRSSGKKGEEEVHKHFLIPSCAEAAFKRNSSDGKYSDREPNFQILLKSIKFLERRIFGQGIWGDVKSIHEPEPSFQHFFPPDLEGRKDDRKHDFSSRDLEYYNSNVLGQLCKNSCRTNAGGHKTYQIWISFFSPFLLFVKERSEV